MRYNATYSPDDNKLRLYPSARLDAETYARVKAAGFRWAPKQDLFVAPAWTPEREDLLLSLAGEIEDEDKTLSDRADERAERFEEYREKRTDDAEQARAAVAQLADNIPLGQPILVGHHSEQRARKDAERIENGMRRAVRMWETAQYWQDRARGAIRHARYKERPDSPRASHQRARGRHAQTDEGARRAGPAAAVLVERDARPRPGARRYQRLRPWRRDARRRLPLLERLVRAHRWPRDGRGVAPSAPREPAPVDRAP